MQVFICFQNFAFVTQVLVHVYARHSHSVRGTFCSDKGSRNVPLKKICQVLAQSILLAPFLYICHALNDRVQLRNKALVFFRELACFLSFRC